MALKLSKMSQQGMALPSNLTYQSCTPGIHIVERREQTQASGSLTPTCGLWHIPPHPTHIHTTHKIGKWNI